MGSPWDHREPADAGKKTPDARAVERALAILELLDSSLRGWNISDLGRKLGIPKSSAHVIVRTLEHAGYLSREVASRNYRLGTKAFGLGRGFLRGMTISELAVPYMRSLAQRTRLTVHMGVRDGDEGIYVQKVEGPGLIRFDTFIGKRFRLHSSAVGKIVLAYAEENYVESFLSRQVFSRFTDQTLSSPTALRKELNKVRKLGYAVDDEEEEPGVRCLAVPVLDHFQKFVAALGVTGTSGQIERQHIQALVNDLKSIAKQIVRKRDLLEAAVPDEDPVDREPQSK